MAVLVTFYLSMYNNIIEVIFMTNIDQLDKILQSLNTELQKNKEIEDLKQIDDKFMENVILDLNSELVKCRAFINLKDRSVYNEYS